MKIAIKILFVFVLSGVFLDQTNSWHKPKIGGITTPEKSRKNTKPFPDLELQIPTLKPSFDSIDQSSI